MRIGLLFIWVCLSFTGLFGQVNLHTYNYTKADSNALQLKVDANMSYDLIARQLTANLNSEQEKFRAIFRWVAENIEYSFANKKADAAEVLKKRKAVCIGYSTLLQAMCQTAGIECEIVTGYSKTTISDINRKLGKPDHAWNAVKLNNEWYLVDVTWAWGYKDMQSKKFEKHFNEAYFLSDPSFFYTKHLPENKNQFYSSITKTKSEFIKGPLYYEGMIEDSVKLLTPLKGELKIKIKRDLVFSFESKVDIKELVFDLTNTHEAFIVSLNKSNGVYKATYAFDKPGNYTLTIFADQKSLVTYKLEIVK